MHTLPKQCRPPSPRRRWRCDRPSYKRSLISRIRGSQAHYLTGPETAETPPITVSDSCGIEPLRDGQAHRSDSACPSPAGDSRGYVRRAGGRQSSFHLVNCQNSGCARGEGARTDCVAGEGREWARGRGSDGGGGGGVTDRATRVARSAGSGGWVEQFSLPQWVSFTLT